MKLSLLVGLFCIANGLAAFAGIATPDLNNGGQPAADGSDAIRAPVMNQQIDKGAGSGSAETPAPTEAAKKATPAKKTTPTATAQDEVDAEGLYTKNSPMYKAADEANHKKHDALVLQEKALLELKQVEQKLVDAKVKTDKNGDPTDKMIGGLPIVDTETKIKVQQIRIELREAREKLEAAKKGVIEASATQNAALATWNKAQYAKIDQAKLNSLKVQRLNEKVAKLELLNDIESLEVDGLSLSQRLDAVDAKIDKSILGAYFQDKVGQLLNSKVFCSAVKNRCGTKDPAYIEQDQLKEIFPDISDKNARSGKENYDKAHSRIAPPAGAAQ